MPAPSPGSKFNRQGGSNLDRRQQFDDCHAAERRYHDAFASKRINGEWFDLEEADIELIRKAA